MTPTIFCQNMLNILGNTVDRPYHLGLAIGMMLHYIEPLMVYHIEHNVDYHNKVPLGLEEFPEYVTAVDDYFKNVRVEGDMTKAFPACPPTRNVLTEKRKVIKRCHTKITAALKEQVIGVLGDKFRKYKAEETCLFNRGVDKILAGAPWVVYPSENVVLAAHPLEWQSWLREKCDELGKIEVKTGRRALADL